MSGEHVFKFSLQYIIWQCTVYIVLLATSAQQLRVLSQHSEQETSSADQHDRTKLTHIFIHNSCAFTMIYPVTYYHPSLVTKHLSI